MKTCVALLVGVLFCGEALAQARNNSPNFDNVGNPANTNTVNPLTNSRANSTSQGGVAAGGTATGGLGGAAGATANPSSSASSGSSTVGIQTGNNTNNFPSDTIIRSAPPIYPPPIATGNVCAIGASGGASWLGAGFAFGASWESMQCERRQTAALLWNMGTAESKAAAKEILCNSPEIRQAYAMIGAPCTVDLTRVAGPAKQTVAAVTPPPVVFDAAQYAKASDCLTAAQAAGAALSACAGKR